MGKRAGWILETIFSPQNMSLQNCMWLYNLSGQIELLANTTRTGLQDLNTQVPTASKTALQNRLSLDLLLLHDNRVCGYLDLNNKDSCVPIPNITTHPDEQLDKIKQEAKASGDLRASLERGWLNKILPGSGFSLAGWLQSLLQGLIYVVTSVFFLDVSEVQ